MGGSSSKSNQTITNNTVNQNYLNTLNKTIMNSAVETMINNASSCSSAVNVNNSCNLSGTNVSGNFNFDGNQTAKASVNFNCIQANQTSADMATSMMASMVAEMKALNGTEAATNLNTAAQSSNNTGFISMPSSSNTSSSANLTNDVTNETINTVKNIFEQNLSNNFTVNTVNECIGKTSISNSQDLSNMNIGGSANIECIQTASVEQVQNCKQLSDSIQKTTQATFQELGMSVDTASSTASSTESTVSSKSENVSTGPIQEIGNAISSIFGAIGLAYLGPILGSVILCCICLVCLCLIMFIGTSLMGSGTKNDSDTGTGIGTGSNYYGFSQNNIPGMYGTTGLSDSLYSPSPVPSSYQMPTNY